MKPIIFLEIDGVLTTQHGSDHWMKAMGDIFDKQGREFFCPKAVEALNKITNATDADIVVTSTWRNNMTLEEMQLLFDASGIIGNVIGFTPFTSHDVDRGQEIQNWMDENGTPKHYVIIDDECEADLAGDYFPDDRCVYSSFIAGLAVKSCYKRAINYLNRAERVKKESKTKNLF